MNELHDLLSRPFGVVGTFILEIRNPELLAILRYGGHKFIIIDMEHTQYDIQTVADLIRSAKRLGLSPLVRTLDHSSQWIGRILDLGATGIVAPNVETRSQAEKIVRASIYPPKGNRSYGLSPILNEFSQVSVETIISKSSNKNLIVVIIESLRGLKNVHEIAKVEKIDVLFIGRQDLSVSLGIPGEMNHYKMKRAIEHIIHVCNRYSKYAGIQILDDVTELDTWRKRGVRFLVYSNDVRMLMKGARVSP